jgi:hypothetical protein
MSLLTPRIRSRWLLPALLMLVVGCERGRLRDAGEGPSVEELVTYYSPTAIKILPFTKPRSFDDDLIPDGVSVSLRPLDSSGDAVKAYGVFIFELYAYKPAIGSHRGPLLQTWTQPVVDPAGQKKFWERVTSTYEFQLSWEGQPIPPDSRYILAATFQARGSARLFDEYEFEFRPDRRDITETLSGKQP